MNPQRRYYAPFFSFVSLFSLYLFFFLSSIVDTFLCWFCLLCFLYANALTRDEGRGNELARMGWR